MVIEKIWIPMCQNYQGYIEVLNQYDFPIDKKFDFYFNLEPLFDKIYDKPEIEVMCAINAEEAVKDVFSIIINVLAHYRHFFRTVARDANLYFYYTGFDTPFVECDIYEHFREIYVSRYTKNKLHSNLSKLFHGEILPKIHEFVEDIANIFIIRADGFDASLVPYIYSKQSDRISLLLTHDFYDTMYFNTDTVYPLYIRKKKKGPADPRFYTKKQIAMDLTRDVNTVICDKPFYYKTLAAAHGSKIRSLYGIKQYDEISGILNELYESGLPDDYNGDTLIVDRLKGSDKDDFRDAFKLFDLEYHASLIPESGLVGIDSLVKSPRKNMMFYQDYLLSRNVNLPWLLEE